MKAIAVSILLLLLALPAAATDVAKPALDATTINGAWQGALVMDMRGESMVMPVTFTFSADGKVRLESAHQPTETQTFAIDAKKNTLTFKKDDGKIDVVVRNIKLTGGAGQNVSMTASIGPEKASDLPKGMTMKLYLSKLSK